MVLVTGCSSDVGTPPAVSGDVRLAVTTVGFDPDLDGFIATLDGSRSLSLPAAGSVTFSDVLAGEHELVLSGLAPQCVITAQSRVIVVKASATPLR